MSKPAVPQLDDFNKLLKFLDGHNGRDKIVRLLQYGGRFLAWWLLINSKPDQAKKFATLEETSSLARKVFRLAKSLSYIQTAIKSFNEESDSVVQLTTVVQNASLAVWLFFDHIIWAAKVSLIKADIPAHAKKANIAWLIAMICGIIKSAYLIQQTQQLVSTSPKAETVQSLRKVQADYLLELIRNVFDLTIPSTSLSKRISSTIPTGIVGLCGTVSSIIGIYQVWAKIK